MKLSKPQLDFATSKATETFYIGGVGSGKTYVLAARAYAALCKPKSIIGIYAPTANVLKQATLKSFQDAWEAMGFIANLHYVVDVKPKWKGVKPLSIRDNKGILTTIWGSYAILDGLENFNAQRGKEMDEIFVDEFRDIRPEARNVLITRLRGKFYKESGLKHKIWYATTPPDSPYYLQSLAENQDIEQKFVFGTSYDNIQNLPEGYIDNQKKLLDPETFEREVMGRFVFSNGKRFAHCFDKSKHIQQTNLNSNLPLYISFDFNVDPATCIIGQHNDNSIIIHDEMRLRNASIYDICDKIKEKYPDCLYIITGDFSGGNREKADRDLRSMYKIIQSELAVANAAMQTFTQNPGHHSNRTLINSMLQGFDIRINSQCQYLIQDLDMVRCDEKGKIDKSNKALGHLLDCFRYYLHKWFGWYVEI